MSLSGFLPLSLLLLITGSAAAQDAAASPEARPPDLVGVYRVHHLDLKMASAMAMSQCPAPVHQHCAVNLREDFFELYADAPTQAKVAAMLKEKDVPARTHQLQAILLIAENNGEPRGLPEALPESAKKVLEELQTVLLFKNFQTLGVARITTGGGEAQFAVAGDYLIRTYTNADVANADSIHIPRFELIRVGEHEPAMRTSLNVRLGETVIVGASTLGGGKQALVLLLTAMQTP